MENNLFDESDQAFLVGGIFALHLNNHKNREPDPDCPFCKGFIIPSIEQAKNGSPFESYSFLILDVSDNGK